MFRAETAARSVAMAVPIITLDIIKHLLSALFPGWQSVPRGYIPLQRMKEAFHAGIVMAGVSLDIENYCTLRLF